MGNSDSQQHLHFPASRVSLSKEGSIGRAFTPCFRENLTCWALQEYWQRKYKWDNQAMSSIDWVAYKSAHMSLSPGQKTTMIKFRTRWIATQSRLFLLQEIPTDLCPCCQEQEKIGNTFYVAPVWWGHMPNCFNPFKIGCATTILLWNCIYSLLSNYDSLSVFLPQAHLTLTTPWHLLSEFRNNKNALVGAISSAGLLPII